MYVRLSFAPVLGHQFTHAKCQPNIQSKRSPLKGGSFNMPSITVPINTQAFLLIRTQCISEMGFHGWNGDWPSQQEECEGGRFSSHLYRCGWHCHLNFWPVHFGHLAPAEASSCIAWPVGFYFVVSPLCLMCLVWGSGNLFLLYSPQSIINQSWCINTSFFAPQMG